MQWNYEHFKYYSTEHLKKAQKNRLNQEAKADNTILRQGIRGKLRPRIR